MKLRGYYAILDSVVDDQTAADPSFPTVAVQQAAVLLAASPCMLQVRAKNAGAAALAVLVRAVLPLARAAGVPLCVNDRLDVALAVGAEAVHLGQDDLPLADARRLAGGRLQIGISTHNLPQARAAVDGSADYIGFGPIFATATKQNPDPVVGTPTLRSLAQEIGGRIPIVAIGGITLTSVAVVAAAGADAAAVIGAVTTALDPTRAGRTVNDAFLLGSDQS